MIFVKYGKDVLKWILDSWLQNQQRYNEYPGSSLPGSGFAKPWEEEEEEPEGRARKPWEEEQQQEGRARVQTEDSTLDLSALQGAQANINII